MNDSQIKLSDILSACGMIAIAIIYYWIAQLGFIFAWHQSNVSAIWPPSALGFLIILKMGRRFWPAIWLGAFLANASYYFSNPSFSLLQVMVFSSVIAIGNTLEAVGGCFLLKKLIGLNNPLKKVRDVFRFMLAGVAGAIMSASIGSLVVVLSNHALWNSYTTIWTTWWLGDFSAILALVPVYWFLGLGVFIKRSLKQVAELIFSLGFLAILNMLILNGNTVMSQMHLPIMFFPFAFVVLITYRLGYVGAIPAILIITFQGIQGTSNGYGTFVVFDPNLSLLLLQTFLDTLTGTILLLAAAIYERSQSQHEVDVREQLFRALVENSFDMKMLLNPTGIISYSSPSTERILGYIKEEHEGHNIFEFIHPEDESRIMGEFTRILTHPNELITATARIRHKNGSWRWVEGSGRNLISNPAVGAVVVNYRDITESRNAQQMIESSEKRLRQIIDLVPHFIFAKDIEGRFILINQAVADAYGTTVEELTGKTDADFAKSEEEVRHFRQDDLEVLHSGEPKIIPEESITDAQGRIRFLSTTKIPFIASGVDLPCILGVSVDITELKKAEEILKNDLKQATRLADIGTLAAIVAHELRTPLGVIQMAAHNLKNKNKLLLEDKHLDNIQKKVWDGNRIIDNLLNYSRIKKPSYEPCSILNLLDECVVNTSGQFQDMGVHIEKDYQIERDLTIEVDGNQIKGVLLNIISNAYQAVTDHQGKIVLTVKETAPEFLSISIKDNGVGIEPGDMDKVFLPFFTTKAKGTGLGLTICNEIINLHHGRLDIHSIKGQGTTVDIILPIKQKISIE